MTPVWIEVLRESRVRRAKRRRNGHSERDAA
jgi:hypothetical protein